MQIDKYLQEINEKTRLIYLHAVKEKYFLTGDL